MVQITRHSAARPIARPVHYTFLCNVGEPSATARGRNGNWAPQDPRHPAFVIQLHLTVSIQHPDKMQADDDDDRHSGEP